MYLTNEQIDVKIRHRMGIKIDQTNVNKYVKAVIINFGDERGDRYVNKNDEICYF